MNHHLTNRMGRGPVPGPGPGRIPAWIRMAARLTARLTVTAVFSVGVAVVLGGVGRIPGVGAQAYDRVSFTLESGAPELLWQDLDGDGQKELLTVSLDGVQLRGPLAGETPARPGLLLGESGRGFVFDLADLDHDGRLELIWIRERGVWVYRYKDHAFVAPKEPVLRIRRNSVPSRPTRVSLVRDLDGDGKLDLIYPSGDRFRLFPGDGHGGFDAARGHVLPSGIRIVVHAPTGVLDAQLVSTFRIPNLVARDVDGDGHPDLMAQLDRRLDIYRGGKGWTFREAPTWVLDLANYESRTAKDEDRREVQLDLGDVNLSQDDLDGDGNRDFLIASGRKVWIYFSGPGFQGFDRPDRILRVAEDIAGVFTGDVDGDGLPDLILVKFEMPSMARLVAALLVGINLEIEALAYRNHGDRSISLKPDRRNRITFSVPPILGLLADLGKLQEKAREIRQQAERLRVGDFNGDKVYDVGLWKDDRIQLYVGQGAGAVAGGFGSRAVMDRVIRDLLFDEKRTRWDIDRLLDYVGDLRYSLNRDQIRDQRPVATLALPPGTFERRSFRFVELNGDGKDDIVVTGKQAGKLRVDLYLSRR